MPKRKTMLSYADRFQRVKDLLTSWFERWKDIPLKTSQSKWLLECIFELGEALYPDFREQIKEAIRDKEQQEERENKDWRIKYK